MNTFKSKFLLPFTAFLLICCIAGLVYIKVTSQKVIYINNQRVFNEFEYKKVLEKKYKQVESARNNKLDSLKMRLQDLYISLESKSDKKLLEQFNREKQNYTLLKTQFDEDNQSLIQEYDSQIWKQLNQYIGDYGKEQGVDFILGGQGQGNVMYAKEINDHTEAVISYVNAKFNGK